jgi:hypothetical protein
VLLAPFIELMAEREKLYRRLLQQTFYALQYHAAKFMLNDAFKQQERNVQQSFGEVILKWIEEEEEVSTIVLSCMVMKILFQADQFARQSFHIKVTETTNSLERIGPCENCKMWPLLTIWKLSKSRYGYCSNCVLRNVHAQDMKGRSLGSSTTQQLKDVASKYSTGIYTPFA